MPSKHCRGTPLPMHPNDSAREAMAAHWLGFQAQELGFACRWTRHLQIKTLAPLFWNGKGNIVLLNILLGRNSFGCAGLACYEHPIG